jgi:hypothetical protein
MKPILLVFLLVVGCEKQQIPKEIVDLQTELSAASDKTVREEAETSADKPWENTLPFANDPRATLAGRPDFDAAHAQDPIAKEIAKAEDEQCLEAANETRQLAFHEDFKESTQAKQSAEKAGQAREVNVM